MSRPVFKVDPEAKALYVRFRKAGTFQTVMVAQSALVTLDLDDKGRFVGLEVIGISMPEITPTIHPGPGRKSGS